MSKRDLRYALVLLLSILWFFILDASECEFRDSPLGFVKGCFNYSVEWNIVLAPTGVIVIIALPVSLLYFCLRMFFLFLDMAAKLINGKDISQKDDL